LHARLTAALVGAAAVVAVGAPTALARLETPAGYPLVPPASEAPALRWTTELPVVPANAPVQPAGVAPVPAPASLAVNAAGAQSFDTTVALAHAANLCAWGPRVEGSLAERKAFDYLGTYLRAYGYATRTQRVVLPGGKSSLDLIVEKPGRTTDVIVYGAHVDSKNPAPGANDNGSGTAALLELARTLRNANTAATVRFVFFGAEEMADRNGDHHHYGSRQYVYYLNKDARARIHGMVSVDMIAVGPTWAVRSMRKGPQTMVAHLTRHASRHRYAIAFLLDPSRYGYSDHEPFELAGIPAAWVEHRTDPNYHTAADVPAKLDRRLMQVSGDYLSWYLTEQTEAELAALRP
jgi:Zn-dependent M28 family amino/carboxypeptidase